MLRNQVQSPSLTNSQVGFYHILFEYELVDKNYARTFELSDDIIKEKEEAKRGHIIFQESEMQTLWDNLGKVRFVDWILIQCYMGWRPQELAIPELEDVHLDERYIVGGMKTQAGRHRMVPIHPKVFDVLLIFWINESGI